jgi:DNA-binding transcriptional regulator GbsR (MarR family)
MKEDGTLSKRRLEAVKCLSQYANPPTVGEMARAMQTNRNNLATRMSELEHLKVVYKAEERECTVSGKECWTWWMTGKQPEGEVPRSINTNEILRGQRDRAMKQAQELDLLLHKVADWLKDTSKEKNKTKCFQAGERMKKRLKKITGEFV